MTYIIPPQQSKKHVQDNKGEFSGTIYQSKNISLDDEGYITLAPTPVSYYNEDNSASFDVVEAMYPSENDLYLNSDEVFSGTLSESFTLTNRSTDTASPSPTVEDDVVYFNATEVVSDGASIYYRSASTTWTAVAMTGFTTTMPTAMTVFHAADSLAVGNDNKVKFVNTSWVVNGTVLTLPDEYQVASMTASGNTLYIATRSKSGGEARMFTINSIQATHDYSYGVGTYELPTITTFKSSVVGVNSLGQLGRFNGGGFTQIAQLPVYNSALNWGDANSDYSVISNRGIFTDGDLLYMNLSSELTNGATQYMANFPSGVWCFDDTTNSLYHRTSASFTKVQSITGTNITFSAANDTFTLTSGNLDTVVTGMPLLLNLNSASTLTGVVSFKSYFVIKSSSTVFKIAETYADAVAGTAINVSGAIVGSDDFLIFKTNDYGWSFLGNRMSIAVLPNTLYNTNLFGNLAFTGDLGAKTAIATAKNSLSCLIPALPNRGYFVTPRFESDQVEDVFQGIVMKHKPLKGDDKLIVKYKTTDSTTHPIISTNTGGLGATWVGTWSDTDTFTTTVDLSDVVAGDEVEIIAGVGSGHIAHVSSITENSGTYTVNLTEAFPFAVATDQMYFVVDKWTYLTEFNSSTPTNLQGYSETQMFATGSFIQFKIEMRGIAVKVKELQVAHQTDKTVSLYN